jgi:hypothetical protein
MVSHQEQYATLSVHSASELLSDIIGSSVDNPNLVSIDCDNDILSLDARLLGYRSRVDTCNKYPCVCVSGVDTESKVRRWALSRG